MRVHIGQFSSLMQSATLNATTVNPVAEQPPMMSTILSVSATTTGLIQQTD